MNRISGKLIISSSGSHNTLILRCYSSIVIYRAINITLIPYLARIKNVSWAFLSSEIFQSYSLITLSAILSFLWTQKSSFTVISESMIIWCEILDTLTENNFTWLLCWCWSIIGCQVIISSELFVDLRRSCDMIISVWCRLNIIVAVHSRSYFLIRIHVRSRRCLWWS